MMEWPALSFMESFKPMTGEPCVVQRELRFHMSVLDANTEVFRKTRTIAHSILEKLEEAQ